MDAKTRVIRKATIKKKIKEAVSHYWDIKLKQQFWKNQEKLSPKTYMDKRGLFSRTKCSLNLIDYALV